MRLNVILIVLNLIFLKSICWSQSTDTIKVISKNKISFITVFDNKNETKDGYYINGFVINLSHEQGKYFHLKKVKITGKVTIIKNVKPFNAGEDIKQGRYIDTKHLLKPVIEIIN
jgi:hypothetical protein